MQKTLLILFFILFMVGQITAQNFVPIEPDTALLNHKQKHSNTYTTMAYLYLSFYYKVSSPIYDTILYNMETSYDYNEICAYKQDFENNIQYSVAHCKESGISEKIIFPSMTMSVVKNLIETLFFDHQNQWINPYMYQPDGAGCYYKIIQEKETTTIDIFCGC